MGSANTELKVEFPYVTKDITVVASDQALLKFILIQIQMAEF